MNWGMRVLQTLALPLGYVTVWKKEQNVCSFFICGGGDEARTRYLHLGKVALYQMSYNRIWCLRSELNQRHADFQSAALPTELQRHMATKKGLEPSTSSVTGWRSNRTELPLHDLGCRPCLAAGTWRLIQALPWECKTRNHFFLHAGFACWEKQVK